MLTAVVLLLQPLTCSGQNTLQIGVGLREANFIPAIDGLSHGGWLGRPTTYFPTAGFSKKIAEHWMVGFQLDYQRHQTIPYTVISEIGAIGTEFISFTQYRIHPRANWQPLPRWRLSLGPEVSVFSRFQHPINYPFAPNLADTEPHFRMQYGLMGGVGFQLDRILLQLNYDWGIAFRNQVVQSIKPISAIDLKLIYEQPLGKKEKRR